MAESPYNLPESASSLTEDDVVSIIQSQLSGYTGQTNFLGNGSMQGSLLPKEAYECGQTVQNGAVAAQESDGKAYRTRATDFSTANTQSNTVPNLTNSYNTKFRLFNLSSTRKVGFYTSDPTGGNVFVSQTVVSPTSSTITSTTSTDIDGGTSATRVDAVLLSTSKAIAVWLNSGARLVAAVVDSLTGTVSVGATASYNTAVDSAGDVAVVKVSSSEVLVFYMDTSKDIQAIPITISGTTATFGASYTILTHATSTLVPRFAETFSGTNVHCLYYFDSTNLDTKVLAVQYTSGSTPTVGSAVSVTETLANTPSGYMANASSTVMCLAERYDTSAGGATPVKVEVRTISRSGTTLTVNSATTIESSLPSGLNNYAVSLTKIASYTFAFGYFDSTTSTVGRLLNLEGVTLSTVGNEYTTSGFIAGNGIVPTFVYHSPARIFVVGQNATNQFFRTVDLTTNFAAVIGIAQATRVRGHTNFVALGGNVTNISGLSAGNAYYADLDGGLTTFSLGGTQRIGTASTTSFAIQV